MSELNARVGIEGVKTWELSITVVQFVGRIVSSTTNAYAPLVLFREKYLAFAPIFLSGLTVVC